MAEAGFSAGRIQPGRLLSLRLRPSDGGHLDALVPGFSGLAIGRQLRTEFLGARWLWLRLGPDEWWCWWAQARADADAHADPEATMSAFNQAMAQATAGLHHAWVDLSDAHQCLVLDSEAHSMLSFGCDLDWQRLPTDLATRTRLASWSVVLAATDGQAMTLWVDASLSLSLQRWLEQASRTLARR